ncbi:sedoheptulose 7-phosphate cyclase [Streptomyces sp. NPDC012623]|uniref:sedoheptulose 7-phosphate cyclase n=1 Tax=unclassified Streptomyces TaxID=2593676 RepID=UPI003675276F
MRPWTVEATRHESYEIRPSENVLAPGNPDLRDAARLRTGAHRLVVVDVRIDELRGAAIRDYFHHWGVRPEFLVLDTDERHKNADTLFTVIDAADRAGLNRRADPIVAIGGGVLTDIVGLAASLFRRGIPFVRVPTTLVGMVDAAVGVKTAINYQSHKNRLGSYFPASVTLLDQGFLRTLPTRHIVNGLAEIIKMAIIRDRTLFELMFSHADRIVRLMPQPGVGQRVIQRAVDGMLAELSPNLWEHELRRLVDFGHTFSPAIELSTEPPLLHGEAVAIDMALCCLLARERGLLSRTDALRALNLMHGIGLPLSHPGVTTDLLLRGFADAVRHRDGHQHLPLPVGLGESVFVEDVTPAEIRRAYRRSLTISDLGEPAWRAAI